MSVSSLRPERSASACSATPAGEEYCIRNGRFVNGKEKIGCIKMLQKKEKQNCRGDRPVAPTKKEIAMPVS